MHLKATFIGQDPKLKNDKEYQITIHERGATRVMIMNPGIPGGVGYPVDYQSLSAFLRNWNNIKHTDKTEQQISISIEQSLQDPFSCSVCKCSVELCICPFK